MWSDSWLSEPSSSTLGWYLIKCYRTMVPMGVKICNRQVNHWNLHYLQSTEEFLIYQNYDFYWVFFMLCGKQRGIRMDKLWHTESLQAFPRKDCWAMENVWQWKWLQLEGSSEQSYNLERAFGLVQLFFQWCAYVTPPGWAAKVSLGKGAAATTRMHKMYLIQYSILVSKRPIELSNLHWN